MEKASRLIVSAVSAGVVAFFLATSPACGPSNPTSTDAGPTAGVCWENPYDCTQCAKPADCGSNKFEWICTPAHRCVKICGKSADCRTGEICEDAVCRPPACGTDDQCTNGDKCIGGACKPPVAPTEVSTCIVLPQKSLLHQGAQKTFSVLARDAAGATLSYKGDVTWSVDQADRAATSGTGPSAAVTGGSAGGAVAVKAKIGSIDCTASAAVNYADAAQGKLRVVVASLGDQTPVKGAKVVVGDSTKTTDDNGAAEFDSSGSSKSTISVFHHDFAYVTLVDVASKDVVVFLKTAAEAGSFKGSMTARSFDNLSDLKGSVHLALFGGSIPGNLVDVQLSTLLGETVKTTIDLGSQKAEVPLPAGTVIGLTEQMFKTDYTVLTPPGIRSVWGIGGNADFSAITRALGPVLSGGDTSNVNVGGILTSLLPLLSKLQSGVVTGLQSEAGKEKSIDVKLDTLLRLRLEANLPDLPQYKIDGESKRFDGAVVLGGALHGSQGLVPLGLTAGIDTKDASGNDGADGKVDPAEAGAPQGKLPLRVAPLHGGLENSDYVTLALAASFSGLVSGDATGGTSTTKTPLVLSGLVTKPGAIPYSDKTATQVNFSSNGFMSVPENPTLQGRAFALGGKVEHAAMHRLDLGDEAGGQWFIYFPGGAANASFEIPGVPDGFDDRLTKTAAGSTSLPRAVVQSIGLGLGTGTALDYEGVVKFDSENMDDLTGRTDAFSAREIIRD